MKNIKLGIKNRAFLFVGLLTGIVILLGVVVFAVIFRSSAMKESARNEQSRLENISTYLDSYIDELSAIANEANYNYYLQNYLDEITGEEETASLKKGATIQNYEMSTKFFSYALNNRADVSSIMVFGRKKLLLHKSLYRYQNILKDYSHYEWYQKAVQEPKKTIVTGPQRHEFLLGNTEKTLSLSRAISSDEDGSLRGVILIDINLNQIDEICKASFPREEENFYIMGEDGTIVYQMKQLEGEKVLQELISGEGSAEDIIKLNGEKYQISDLEMGKTGWRLVSAAPVSYITKSVNNTVWFIVISGLLLLGAVILMLNVVLTRVVSPITLLKKSMDEAEMSNLKVRVAVLGQDETAMLALSYNKLMDRIEHLMGQVVEEQEEKRKFELQALQAQINPHFLYNTLDSIIWMAETENHNVVPMTEALARLFRISLNKGNEFIKVKDEMEHVRNYLVIQSMRYLDKFQYNIAIEDEVKDCKTIKLMVQPIVENAIYHGIKKQKGKGSIHVAAAIKGDCLVITVKDDGNGMDEQTCRQILVKDTSFANTGGSGIGVKNVNERIKLYFGERYGLQFQSEEGRGTLVTITLPVLREGQLSAAIQEKGEWRKG